MSERRRRLLLIEDDADLGSAIADGLQDSGLDVLHVENGKDALRELDEGYDPDVIVLDLMMPEMNGWQFRAAQKADPRLASTPVVVISADHSAQARTIDADIYLAKPFPLQSLVGAVERAMALRARRVEAAERAHSDRIASIWTLAAGIAHEINNPLTGLLGNLDLARRMVRSGGELPLDRLENYLGNVNEAALQIARVVKDAASLASGEEKPVPIDPRQVVGSALELLASEIAKRARVDLQLQPVPPVRGRPAQLQQVFVNLLLNAVQSFDRDEQGTVRIRSFTTDTGDVVIEIGDDGCGIPSHQLGTIFEPFFTTKPPGQGTGLGLSISHQIVSEMGGRITVDSALGAGSTFRVYLPTASQRLSGVRRIDVTKRSRESSKLRILIVEDDETVSSMLQLLLLDHDVVAEEGIHGARERVLAGEPFDVVLCDLNLLDGTGAELYDTIVQSRPEFEERFLLMTSGPRRPEEAAFVKRLGSRVLFKPFRSSVLAEAIRELTATVELRAQRVGGRRT